MTNKFLGILVTLLLSVTVLSAQKRDAFQTAMYMEKWQKAVTLQEEKCKTDTDNWLNWIYMSDAYLAASRPVDARTSLEKAAQHTIQSSYQQIIAARLALLNGQAEEAAKLFKKAAKSGKRDIVARRLIGESWLYGSFRNIKKAEIFLLEAEKRNSRDFQTHMDLGYCYRTLLDGGNALTQFDIAQSLEPENALPALMSAMVYKSARVENKQLEYLDKALVLEPQFKSAVRQKAELFYYRKRDYQAAAETYAKLLEINPKVPIEDKMAYVNSLFLTKQYEQTILWVDKIIGEDGSRNYLRRLSAYSYYETENFEKGKAIMDEYFARVTTDKIIPQDFEYYAKLLQKENQDSLAAVYYGKAIELDPARWDLYSEIGAIRYKTKDYLGAAEAFERRLDSLTSRKAIDYYKVGLARYMVQDSANYIIAAEYFAKVSNIVPDNSIGWLMQARSLSKTEPDLEVNPERSAEFGKAKEAFERFVEIAEKEDVAKQAKDLIAAYEYLAYFYILQNDEEKVGFYLKKLEVLEPNNDSITAIAEWLNKKTTED